MAHSAQSGVHVQTRQQAILLRAAVKRGLLPAPPAPVARPAQPADGLQRARPSRGAVGRAAAAAARRLAGWHRGVQERSLSLHVISSSQAPQLAAQQHIGLPAQITNDGGWNLAQAAAEVSSAELYTLPPQVDVLEAIKASLFPPVARLLYGHAFVSAHGSAALQSAFFDFEETFELAASPVPHIFQHRFTAARRFLLSAFR